MVEMEICGMGRYDFERDGRRFAGWKYHGLVGSTRADFMGREAISFTLSDDKLAHIQGRKQDTPKVGDIVQLVYNRFGRVDDVYPVDM